MLLKLGQLKGVSPNVTLACEPWGHMNHDDGGCECLSSDLMGAYVHELALTTSSRDLISDFGESPDAVSSGLSGVPGDCDADFFGLWRACTLSSHVSGFGTICVPSAWSLQQAAIGRARAVVDGSAGSV